MALTPMQDPSGDDLTYAVRDFVGVQPIGDDPGAIGQGDFQGVNEIFAWTRRAEEHALVEHFANGVHDTLKIARAFVWCEFDENAVSYGVRDQSYSQDTSGGVDGGIAAGTTAATASRVATGHIEITLTNAMPSSTIGIIGFCQIGGNEGSANVNTNARRVWLDTVSSSTVFRVRLEEYDIDTAVYAPVDASFMLAVFG